MNEHTPHYVMARRQSHHGWIEVTYYNRRTNADPLLEADRAFSEFYPIAYHDGSDWVVVNGKQAISIRDLLVQLREDTPYEHLTYCWGSGPSAEAEFISHAGRVSA